MPILLSKNSRSHPEVKAKAQMNFFAFYNDHKKTYKENSPFTEYFSDAILRFDVGSSKKKANLIVILAICTLGCKLR